MALVSLSLNEAKSLITEAQTLTDAWANVGDRISTGDAEDIALWLDVDVNDSETIQVRVLGYEEALSEDAYVIPILDVGETVITLADQVFTLPATDSKVIVPVSLAKSIPYCQVQVIAGTVGATAGELLSAKATHKMR